MSLIYTGVGSRDTPDTILKLMEAISFKLTDLGYIGRSGGATGADTAFWNGFCANHKLNKKFEMFLPWNKYNGYDVSDKFICDFSKMRVWEEAKEIMESIHPNPKALSRGACALHTRNVPQVLGADLKTPSNLLICYAKPANKNNPKKDEVSGGTRTAVELAKRYKIPVYNLYFQEDIDYVCKRLKLS